MENFKFEKSYGRLLGLANSYVSRRLSKYMREQKVPVTPEQFRLLTHLWHQDGLTQQELADGTHRDKANVTRILDILEREIIIERRNDPKDRRVYKIFLTAKGKEIERDAAECSMLAINDALKDVTKEEIEMCKNVLNTTIKNLE